MISIKRLSIARMTQTAAEEEADPSLSKYIPFIVAAERPTDRDSAHTQ